MTVTYAAVVSCDSCPARLTLTGRLAVCNASLRAGDLGWRSDTHGRHTCPDCQEAP